MQHSIGVRGPLGSPLATPFLGQYLNDFIIEQNFAPDFLLQNPTFSTSRVFDFEKSE